MGCGKDGTAGQIFVANDERTLASMTGTEFGGIFHVINKTGEDAVQILADDYGHGYLGVFDRHGKGPVIQPR